VGPFADEERPLSRVCLINGVPGVGKTTLCQHLVEQNRGTYSHIPFGQLILQVLRSTYQGLDERELRQTTTKFVTQDVIGRATDLLVEELERRAFQCDWLLVDSHAVSQDWFGYLATPDGKPYFERVAYQAIVHLYASSDTVLGRSNSVETGRRARNASDLALHSELLNAVSIVYSSHCGCPAYFVDANGSSAETATNVDTILRRGAM